MLDLVRETIIAHKRVIFNGNGYADEWVEEAKARGLYNLKSTPEALPAFKAPKNVELFTKHGVFSETEITSRTEILFENYVKTLHIETLTMQDMVHKEFLPAVMKYADSVCESISAKKAISASLPTGASEKLLEKLSTYYEEISEAVDKLVADTDKAEGYDDLQEQAMFYHDVVKADMDALREVADKAEELLPEDVLPYPTYEQMLFYV